MKRRSFLTWMGLGWLASVLLVAIAACTSQFKRLESRPRPDGFQAIGTVAELEQNPGTIQVQNEYYLKRPSLWHDRSA